MLHKRRPQPGQTMNHTTTDRQRHTAALAIRLAAACRDPRHHCALVLAANAGLVVCAAAEPFTPALALHLALLPINAWRLLQALRAGPSSRPPSNRTTATRQPMEAVSESRNANSPWRPGFQALATAQTVRLPPRRVVS